MENPNDRRHHRPPLDARRKAPTDAAAAFCSVQVLKIRAKDEQQIHFCHLFFTQVCLCVTCLLTDESK